MISVKYNIEIFFTFYLYHTLLIEKTDARRCNINADTPWFGDLTPYKPSTVRCCFALFVKIMVAQLGSCCQWHDLMFACSIIRKLCKCNSFTISKLTCSIPCFRWVREFLSEENKGLDVLVNYLSDSQAAMRQVSVSVSLNVFIFLLLFPSLCLSLLMLLISYCMCQCQIIMIIIMIC